MYYKLKKLFLIISFIIFLTDNSFAFSVTPAIKKIEALPGETINFNIQINNEENYDCQVKITPKDIFFDKKGKRNFKLPSSKGFSQARSIRIDPNNFQIERKKSKSFNVSVTIPDNLYGGSQTMIIMTSSPILDPKKFRSKVIFEAEIGCLVLAEAKGTVKNKSRIKSVDILKDKKSLKFTIDVLNQGNSHIEAQSVIAIFDKDENFVTSINTNKKIIYPNQSDKILGELKGDVLPQGLYHAIVNYQYDEDKNISIDKVFEVK